MDQISWQKQIFPFEYDVFAGMDVDKTSISLTLVDHGELERSMRIPNNADNLISFVSNQFKGRNIAFAYEAGPTGFGLYDRLNEKGYPCLVVAPNMIPAVKGRKVKTNRIDSKKLALSLRGGQLKGIYVPTKSIRNLRHLVQLRDTYVRQLISAKLRIKALLLFEGIPFPCAPPSNQWSNKVIQELKNLKVDEAIRFKLDSLLRALEFSKHQVLDAIKQIRRYCLDQEELKGKIANIITISGIGWITATHLLARIGDIASVQNSKEPASFLGLVPTENSTGDRIEKGSITRAGDSRLRSKLIQCAWYAIRKDPELAEFYTRIYKRHPRHLASRKAIVAVARKLTVRIYTVLRENRPYIVKYDTSLLKQEEKKVSLGKTRFLAERNGSILETETPRAL